MQIGSGQFEVEAAKAARGVASRLEQIRPVKVTSFELPPVLLATKFDFVDRLQAELHGAEAAIYAISLPDAAPTRIYDALKSARDGKVDDRCYSRVPSVLKSASSTLYVGSSRTLQKRLLEHLGHGGKNGAKKTYSLHMLTWAQELGRVAIDVRFYPSTIENDLLCALEDHWAATLKPLFGKRGSV